MSNNTIVTKLPFTAVKQVSKDYVDNQLGEIVGLDFVTSDFWEDEIGLRPLYGLQHGDYFTIDNDSTDVYERRDLLSENAEPHEDGVFFVKSYCTNKRYAMLGAQYVKPVELTDEFLLNLIPFMV